MLYAILTVLLLCLAGLLVRWLMRRRLKKDVARFSVSPEELQSLLEPPDPVLLLDVRLPLDLLAASEVIPGSVRKVPRDIINDPSIIPFDRDIVFYCTCPSDETSREMVRRAHKAKHNRVKFLRGGLAGWKEKGFAIETYETPFHLDTATAPPA